MAHYYWVRSGDAGHVFRYKGAILVGVRISVHQVITVLVPRALHPGFLVSEEVFGYWFNACLLDGCVL